MRGIGPIVAADFSSKRRALAEQLGADVVVDPRITPAIEAWRQADGVRTPVIFEAVGVPGMIDQAMRMAPKDARILIVGACMQEDRFHPMLGIGRELSLQFALGYEPGEFSAALTVDRRRQGRSRAVADGHGRHRRDPAGLPRSRQPRATRQDHGDAMTVPTPTIRSRASTRAPGDSRSANRATSWCRPTDSASSSFAAAPATIPINCLYVLDVAKGEERLIADPLDLLMAGRSRRPSAGGEARRRERMRETASGVTTFATDKAVTVVAFPLAGRLFVAGLISGMARELDVDGPVFDPRPDPGATRLAYVCGNALRIAELDGSSWELASDDDPDVSWGSADYIAGEELHRYRGYWWSPDGAAIAACRVDVVARRAVVHLRPGVARPAVRARCAIRQPARPTPTSVCTCSRSTAAASRSPGTNDRFPYLTAVHWASNDRLLLTVQSRDQRDLQVLEANPTTGDTAPIFTDHDDTLGRARARELPTSSTTDDW